MRKKHNLKLPNKFGGIVYLGDRRRKPYGVRVTTGWNDRNRQTYKYLGYFEEYLDAMEFLIEFNKNPYDINIKEITLKKIYDDWSKRHFDKVSLHSKRAYISAFKKCEHLYNMPFVDLRTKHFQDIVDPMKSVSTAQMFRNVIKMLYQYALKHDIVDKDYSAFIEMPNAKKKHIKKIFTNDEINALWNYQECDAKDVLLILLFTGMRIGEILKMKVENIHFEERYMIGGFKTEAGLNRMIPIHKKIVPIIEKRLKNKYLFQGVKSGKNYDYSYMSILISKVFNDLNINHTIHETRHTFISQADRLDLNKITLKKIVGHSVKGNDITNDVYTHKNKEDVIEFIDLFYY